MNARPEIRTASILATLLAAPFYGAFAVVIALGVSWPADVDRVAVSAVVYAVAVLALVYIAIALLWRLILQLLIDHERLGTYQFLTASRRPTTLFGLVVRGANLAIGFAAVGLYVSIATAGDGQLTRSDLATGTMRWAEFLAFAGVFGGVGLFVARAALGEKYAWRLTAANSEPETTLAMPWRAQLVTHRSPAGDVLAWENFAATNGLAFDETIRNIGESCVVGAGRYGWSRVFASSYFQLWHVERFDPYVPDSPPAIETLPSALVHVAAFLWTALGLAIAAGDVLLALGAVGTGLFGWFVLRESRRPEDESEAAV